MKITVEIAKEADIWQQHDEITSEYFSDIIQKILSRYPNFSRVNDIELSVLLTDNAKMQALNHEFRKKNKPTNVLSFQDLEINWRNIVEFKPDGDYIYLGDIAFGHQIIVEEAKNKAISFEDHFKHLTIHAILHLIGYDHNTEEEAEIMESLETEILEEFGISSPY